MTLYIKKLLGTVIKDSRGIDTVSAELFTSDGKRFTGSVPSGQSVGRSEAKTQAPYDAAGSISLDINAALGGKKLTTIDDIDTVMTRINVQKNEYIGANAILPVSIAATHALAYAHRMPTWRYISEITGIKPNLPLPMMVMIEGGKHGEFKGVTWQEFLLNAPMHIGREFLISLRSVLNKHAIAYKNGVEGGICLDVESNSAALELFLSVFHTCAPRYTFSIDCAATHNALPHSDLAMLFGHTELMSIEDPASEEEWSAWTDITRRYGLRTLIVGDDLITTNPVRLQKAIKYRACNAIIIKPNQVGSVSETLKTARLAHNARIAMIVSHRAGETMDTFIADCAVGIGAHSIKSGAPTQKERIVKYKRIETIKKEMQL